MSLSTTSSRVVYTGNDVADSFAVPFPFLADEDLVVIERVIATGAEATLVYATDYTVTGAGDEAGGTVTLVAGALPASKKLVILRQIALTQPTEWPSSGPFPAASHEAAADRGMMASQQLQEQLDRAVGLPPSSALSGVILPDPPAAGALLGWNEAGDNLVNGPTAAQVASAQANASAAAASAGAASASAAAAAASAARINLPELAAGDAGKVLAVNDAEDGYQHLSFLEMTLLGQAGTKTVAGATPRAPDDAWETIVAGSATVKKLVTLDCGHGETTSQVGALSADGGTTEHGRFSLSANAGRLRLGSYLLTTAAQALAVKSVGGAYLQFGAEVQQDPAGVKRLSGLSGDALFLDIPAAASPTLAHTTTTDELVVLLAVPKSGCTAARLGTRVGASQWSYKSIQAGDHPVTLFCQVLPAGTSVYVGGDVASQASAWGWAKEVSHA